jgi:hypothetical protein
VWVKLRFLTEEGKGFVRWRDLSTVFRRLSTVFPSPNPALNRAFIFSPQVLPLATTTTFIYIDLAIQRTFH